MSWTYKKAAGYAPILAYLGKEGYWINAELREEGVARDERVPIRKAVSRRRLRSVMQDLIYMASRVVTHARRMRMTFGRRNSWYPVWQRVYNRFVGAYS